MPHAGKDAQSRRAARAFNRGGEILAVARAHDRILVAAREPQRRRVATREADRLGLLDRPDLAHRLFGAAALFERPEIIGESAERRVGKEGVKKSRFGWG